MTHDPLTGHHERLAAQVGTERSERLGTLTERDVARFAMAAGGDDTGTAHPLLLSSVMGWCAGPAPAELGADGAGGIRGLALDGVRLMGAGQELEFHRPVAAGTAVVVHTGLVDVRLTEGRTGPLLLLRLRSRFTDDAGLPLVTCVESFIARQGVR